MQKRERYETGPQPETWHVTRLLLVVVRNPASLDRLLDYLPLFAGDDRIGVEFTVDRGSNFSAGIEKHLEKLGVRSIPWEQAVQREYHLILAAHANKHMCRLKGPIFLVPHGAGYNRNVVANTMDPTAAVGTSEHELMADGVVYMKMIGVSHPDQIEQIRRSCPQAAGRAKVIGDLTYARMRASVVQRRRYRDALGVGTTQKLVVVTSTWGGHSAMGSHKHRDFVNGLVAQLPMDEFKVALVIHPNVWATHSDFTIRQMFRDAVDGGLVLIPPDNGWRAALIAADFVLGDHGSVTFYGFALRKPTARVADGLEELVPDSALAMFCHSSVKFDLYHSMREQLAALKRDHDPLYTERVSGQVIMQELDSHQAVYDIVYRELDLVPPIARPRMAAIPLPKPIQTADDNDDEVITTSFIVSPAVDVDARRVSLERFPGTLSHKHSELSDLADGFLVVDQREVDMGARQSADVFFDLESRSIAGACDWITETAHDYPGVKVIAATTESCCLICLRDHRSSTSRLLKSKVDDRPGDAMLAASAVHAWTMTLQPFTDEPLPLTVTIGATSSVYSFSLVP